MFRQEINLYRDFEEPAPTVAFLSWHQMILSQVLIVIALSVLSVFSYLSTELLARKKTEAVAQATELKNKFYTEKSKFPQAFFNQDVALSIEQLTNQMKVREQILKKIANNNLFSNDLETLGKIIIPDVWLTDIHITNAGDTVSIKGKSGSSEKMQVFLANLSEDNTFKDYSLSVNSILDNTKTARKGDLDFDITLTKNAL